VLRLLAIAHQVLYLTYKWVHDSYNYLKHSIESDFNSKEATYRTKVMNSISKIIEMLKYSQKQLRRN